MKLKIGILGTRGVPNRYGGFEQFAAHLSQGLAARGHAVTVYNPHNHSCQEKKWNGVHIVHCYDPGHWLGTSGQFIYDLNCIKDARKQSFDILLILGYTSSSVWGRWYPKQSVVITNMDGMEWKRSKYNALVRRFLRYAEKLAITFSKYHVADSPAVKEYLDKKYQICTKYISYGTELPGKMDNAVLQQYGISIGNYYLLVARMEPENNIEIILQGLCDARVKQKVLVVGDIDNAFGRKMVAKFGTNPVICFTGSIYNAEVLNTLRCCCMLYFHGHSVGGTNPSLLEAMACGALICAHDNPFNRAVLANAAFYFNSVQDVSQVCANMPGQIMVRDTMINQNLAKVRMDHSWEKIVTEYETLFIQSIQPVR